jgi:hypothetical protein
MTDHDMDVVEQMEKYGGSFVQALAVCFRRADPNNLVKLKETFAEYWQQYEQMLEGK